MFDRLICELKDSLNKLEESKHTKDLVLVQYLLHVIDDVASEQVVEYVKC